jgi:hypothetical protein
MIALLFLAACGGSAAVDSDDAGSAGGAADAGGSLDAGAAGDAGAAADAGAALDAGTALDGGVPALGGCPLFPANHIFNTPISSLPVDSRSAAYLATIGTAGVHLDLGTQTDTSADDYYGIPYNVVHGNALTWPASRYYSADTDLDWTPQDESDCSAGSAHAVQAPCTAAAPLFPIPAHPLVEGGIVTDPAQPYGDHHLLIVDQDQCRLWELYHTYPDSSSGWDIFGSASWDLHSNALRPAGWTSSDAAGFPITPLLIKQAEAASGVIRHALRFTILSSHIRNQYVWPARHLTGNGTSSVSLPPMGQLFRLKASYVIPAGDSVQAKAILQALKTYGMYIADGGSNLYVQGEPNAAWDEKIFAQLSAVKTTDFEAVDITAIASRAGFDVNSAAVP